MNDIDVDDVVFVEDKEVCGKLIKTVKYVPSDIIKATVVFSRFRNRLSLLLSSVSRTLG